MKACAICGAPARQGTRCAQHAIAPHSYSRTYQANARLVVANAHVCHICGQPARNNDPFTADHIIPHSHGGSISLQNLKPAHRSCNSRRGTNAA
jgi:5-methylcytosine-specific restriction endonuclease McrA